MFLDASLRFPAREVIPTACFKNEAAFSDKRLHNQKLAIQARTQRVKLCWRSRHSSPADDFRRTHLFLNRQRKSSRQVEHLFAYVLQRVGIGAISQCFSYQIGDLQHLSSFMPRVVTAGVPMRMPPGLKIGYVSNGIPFLFTVMPARSRTSCASLPLISFGRRSTSIKWLSVPPETIR